MMKAHPHLPPFPSRERREIDIDKERIKLSFSNAAKIYDSLATLQKEVAEELLNKLSAASCQPSAIKILDIGCGTGFLTHGLARLLPKADIFGCDIAHEMTEHARCKVRGVKDKKIYFLTADGGVLPYKDKAFGMVASNLTYQWIHDMKTAFSEAHRVLRPGGIFTFSTLGTETLKELRYCYAEASAKFNKDDLPPFINFSGQETIISALRDTGFDNISITAKDCIRTYHNMWELLKNMKSIGAGNPFKGGDKSLARGSLLKKMAEMYEQKFVVGSSGLGVNIPHPTSHIPHPNDIYATYEVMFVKAVKL